METRKARGESEEPTRAARAYKGVRELQNSLDSTRVQSLLRSVGIRDLTEESLGEAYFRICFMRKFSPRENADVTYESLREFVGTRAPRASRTPRAVFMLSVMEIVMNDVEKEVRREHMAEVAAR